MSYQQDSFHSDVFLPYNELLQSLEPGYSNIEIKETVLEKPEILEDVVDGVMHTYGLQPAPADADSETRVGNISVYTEIIDALEKGISDEEVLKRFMIENVI